MLHSLIALVITGNHEIGLRAGDLPVLKKKTFRGLEHEHGQCSKLRDLHFLSSVICTPWAFADSKT